MDNSSGASIVLVEDEPDLMHLVKIHLERAGYRSHCFESAEACIDALPDIRPQLAIIDWMLPGLSGLELCRKIDGAFPVIMLTARADPKDVIRGLEAGADDYVTKPFDPPILLARIKALLRRAKRPPQSERESRVLIGSLVLDLDSHTCTRRGEEFHLTTMEFRLLAALLEASGKVLTRDKLIASVQGFGVAVTDRTIDQHVYRLRKKLEADGDCIESIRGVGYRIIEK